MGHAGAAGRRGGQRVLIWVIGLAVTVVMIALGLWQAQSFRTGGQEAMIARLTGPPAPLEPYLAGGEGLAAAYGSPVEVRGSFAPDQQLLAGTEPPFRVVAAFTLADGRVLPVVRGTTDAAPGATISAPPAGEVTLTGVLLPSDPDAPTPQPTAGVVPGAGFVASPREVPQPDAGSAGGTAVGTLPRVANVRLAVIAQSWPQPMHPGYVTLDADLALDAGLAPAVVRVPDDSAGRARNRGYALQWWVFAMVAMAATVKLSHDASRGTGFFARRPADAGTEPTAHE